MMRFLWVLGGVTAITAAAAAAELPLANVYGTASACASQAGEAFEPADDTTLIALDGVRFQGVFCPFTSVSDLESEGGPAWEVRISCAQGHDEEVPATLRIAEAPLEGRVTIELLDGAGPEGAFEVCTAG